MKKLFLILLFPTLLSAQTGVNLKFVFKKAVSDSCILRIVNTYIDEYESKSGSCKKVDEISFNVQKFDKPAIGKLFYDKQTTIVFIESGDDWVANISNDSLNKTITFSGKGAEQNNFLTSFNAKFINDYDKDRLHQTMLTTAIDPFEMHLFDEVKMQKEFYGKQDKSKFSKAFNDYMDQTIRYSYYASLLSYPIVNANQSTKILTVNALPEVMLKNVDSKLINDEALISETYRDFIIHYVVYSTSKANGFNKFTDYNLSMERKVAMAKKLLTGKTLIWYIANFLNNDCDKVSPFTVKNIYNELKEMEKDGYYTQLIKKKCETRINTKEVVAKEDKAKTDIKKSEGQSKNAFEGVMLKDINGKIFNPKDLEGKVVFIDFWASWCGPCRQEFPYSKLLHERFSAKQLKSIVFLYISIDGNETNWKNAVQQIGMEGTLLISPGDWSSQIANYFGINSIPRYMLMDKKGTISNTNAPRPSSGDVIYNEILKLLNQ